MPMIAYVAIDSNCLTYLVDAMYSCERPIDDLADQKIALLRIYLYRDEILYISSTVQSEYRKIRDASNKERHEGISNILLGDVPKSNPKTIEDRFCFYTNFHKGKKNKKDCRILAESELGDCQYLLTYDFKYLSRLKEKTEIIKMKTPVEFWSSLNIPKGAKPVRTPHPTNPLSNQTWWIWKTGVTKANNGKNNTY